MFRLLSVLVLLCLSASPLFAAASATDVPLGQSSASADDLFETQRGYFHPELSLSEVYTDNLFNRDSATETEYITTITPAFWLSFPGQLQPAEPIVTDTTSAGGLLLSRFGKKDERPFNAFLRYEAGIKRHKNFDSEDITTHKLHALVRNTLTSGLSVEATEVFTRSHDAYATGSSIGQNEFDSNLLALKGSLPVGERFQVRIEYRNFQVDYDEATNNFRDRTDNGVTGSLYYALSQKTRLFGQLGYVDVEYDSNPSNDNSQMKYYLGVDYEISEKVRARAKLGVSSKDAAAGQKDLNDFVYELQGDYQFTPKNNLILTFWQQQKETDTTGTNGILGRALNATFSQQLARRLVGTCQAGWSQDDYNGSSRTDDYLTLSLSLGYSLQKWFEVSGGYNFVQRDSSATGFDYDSNGLFVNLTGKL